MENNIRMCEIYHVNSSDFSSVRLSSFAFSKRATNILVSNNILTIGDLLNHSLDDICNLKNAGEKTVAELNNFLRDYLSGNYSSNEDADIQIVGNGVEVDNIYIDFNDKIADVLKINLTDYKIPICFDKLSTRTKNALKNNQYITIDKLLSVPLREIRDIHHLGSFSFNEVLRFIFSEIKGSIVPIENSTLKVRSSVSTNLKDVLKQIFGNKPYSVNLLNDDEIECVNNIKKSIEILGLELACELYNEPDKARYCSYVTSCISYRYSSYCKKIEKIKANIFSLPKDILSKKIKPFILCYNLKKRNDININELFTPETTVGNLINELKYDLFIKKYDMEYLDEVSEFITWLMSFAHNISSVFFDFINQDSKVNTDIIDLRLQGKTLEEIAEIKGGLTRERIRQKEKKQKIFFVRKLNSFQCDFILYTSAVLNGDPYITKRKLCDVVGEKLTEYIWFCFKENNKGKYYSFLADYNMFVIHQEDFSDEAFLKYLNSTIASIPMIFNASELQSIINVNTDDEFLKCILIELIKKEYKLNGKFYHKSQITVAYMVEYVLKHYFPNGIKTSDEADIELFQKYLKQDFGDKGKDKTNRAIISKIGGIGMLCGRGEYIHPDNITIDDSLISLIFDFINNYEGGILPYATIYEELKKYFKGTRITNRYVIQGLLKKNNLQYLTNRDSIIKDPEMGNIYNEILNYIVSSSSFVDKTELQNKFPGVSEVTFNAVCCGGEVLNFFGKYINAENLKFLDDDIIYFGVVLEKVLNEQGHIHSDDIFSIIKTDRPHLLERYGIYYHFALFSVLEYFYRDVFAFSRPYISLDGVDYKTSIELIQTYVSQNNVLSINELKAFTRQSKYTVYSILEFLDSFNDTHVILNKEQLCSLELLNISKEDIETLENDVFDEINDYSLISSLTCFSDYDFLPDDCDAWFIYSLLKKHSSKLDVFPSSPQFHKATPMVAKYGMVPDDLSEFDGITDTKLSRLSLSDFDFNLEDLDLEDFD